MSLGFVISSIIGALVYSTDFINCIASALNFETQFTKEQTVKFPLYLNFVSALIVFFIACKFEEDHKVSTSGKILAIKESFAGTRLQEFSQIVTLWNHWVGTSALWVAWQQRGRPGWPTHTSRRKAE